MSSIEVYLPASKVYEITNFARKSGDLRKAHLPFGVHTTGNNWVGLEFFSERGARKFRSAMRPRRKGFEIVKYFSSLRSVGSSTPKKA